jgi:cytochrome d ubiquinol oxidase subunit II
MPTLWFCLVAAMLAVYVLLDGFDLGVGIIFLGVAHTEAERRTVLASIGPVRDANEVWLIAAGGTLFFAFPVLYASSFSGFYLPLTIVLWLLILRGISIEFRSHLRNPLWAPLWDLVFCGASVLLAIFYGVALGNVVRGVPLDATGYFFEALWTNFRFGKDAGILDWYTILVGFAAYFALAEHGALWVAHKTDGVLRDRARRMARMGWWGVAFFTLVVTVVTLRVQPQVMANLSAYPAGFVSPLLAVAGLASSAFFLRISRAPSPSRDLRAFLASSTYLAGMLASVAFGLYPYVLPARDTPSHSLSIYNASTTPHGLSLGLAWWPFALLLALAYFFFLYRGFAGKVTHDDSSDSK